VAKEINKTYISKRVRPLMPNEISQEDITNAINITCVITTMIGTACYCIIDRKSEYHLHSFYLMCCGFGATALNMVINIPSDKNPQTEHKNK
jgi:hypothetical protein